MRITKPLLVLALFPASAAAPPAEDRLRGEYFADRSFTLWGRPANRSDAVRGGDANAEVIDGGKMTTFTWP